MMNSKIWLQRNESICFSNKLTFKVSLMNSSKCSSNEIKDSWILLKKKDVITTIELQVEV